VGPGDLGEILQHLPAEINPDVLVGMETKDDAGALWVSEDLAMIQTVDFFTPIVDDPYDYGQIAAANSLSDIYAMGGIPRTALNILGFPNTIIDKKTVSRIILGGYEKAREAGVAVLGGHSVKDPELKFGLAVTGFINPGEIIRNSTAKPGDLLVLTKPIGTGILTTALKNEKLPDDLLRTITTVMKQLNKTASETMKRYKAHACTDITGYGLMGHLFEMVEGSSVSAIIEAEKVPLFPRVLEFARAGNIPGGLKENLAYMQPMIKITPGIEEATINVLHDPQTSGGLLISLPPENAQALVKDLRENSGINTVIIGEMLPKGDAAIEVY
jgi:selenide,water dikinase